MTGVVTAKFALRVAAWLIAGVVVVNVAALLSPWHILVRTVVESYVADSDIVYSAMHRDSSKPADAGGFRKVCVYWGGGFHLNPTFTAVDHKCALFREKQGSSRLVDW